MVLVLFLLFQGLVQNVKGRSGKPEQHKKDQASGAGEETKPGQNSQDNEPDFFLLRQSRQSLKKLIEISRCFFFFHIFRDAGSRQAVL